jgi:multiple sugar transport system substrate-binding protein
MPRQFVSCAFLVVLVGALLLGCAAPAAPAPAPAAPAAPAAATAASAAPAAAQPTAAAAAPAAQGKFPPGKMVGWGYGQPAFYDQFLNGYIQRNPDIAAGVTVETLPTKGEEEVRQKAMLAMTSGQPNDLPDYLSTAPVSMQAMADAGILMDMTSYLESFKDKLVPGTLDQMYYKGKLWCLPRSLRPQILFYNKEIFDKYNIDPQEMSTFEGYLNVGKKLRDASKGEVFLSYVDPGDRTWRYWGRRGLMPQAKARIWDDDGNVVIDQDPGTKLALGYLETLLKEKLLYNSAPLQPPLYEATRQGKVATYYIGAFYDEFTRANLGDMAGKWRVMKAPVFKDIGLGGAPVIEIQCITNKPNAPYAELYKKMWEDYNFNAQAREAWTNAMVAQKGAYGNPIAKDLLAQPFWKQPEPYYGGQSFREWEGIGLENPSENLRVTQKDAEADTIITAEIEKVVAGNQTMDQAIANMGKNLRDKIGKAPAK